MDHATSYETFTSGHAYDFMLAPGGNSRHACAQIRDDVTGETSAPMCDAIILQLFGTGAPTAPSVTINQNAYSTTQRNVNIHPVASGATKMAISNDNSFTDAVWVDYAAVKQWFLSAGSGSKQIVMIFASESGAVTEVVDDWIEYSPGSQVPEGEISIENGVVNTHSIDVRVKTDDVDGADVVRLGSDSSMTDALQFQAVKTWLSYTLKPGVGTKFVCAEFKNETSGITSDVDCDSINLKKEGGEAPDPGVLKIDDDEDETLDARVLLEFNATNVDRYAVSNNADFKNTNWLPYVTTREWTLQGGPGEKTVYVMFASSHGHVSEVISEDIKFTGASEYVASPDEKAAPATPSKKRSLPNGIKAGMLVKKYSSPDVYYVGVDGYRYVFPDQQVFLSWYTTQDLELTNKGGLVTTLATGTLASIPVGGNVTYRPGVRLVKIQTDPRVYAVDRHGVLRWITNATVAASLYGTHWNALVRDVNESYFVNYGFGKDIVSHQDFTPVFAKRDSPSIEVDKELTGL